jgi:hypothetical protein
MKRRIGDEPGMDETEYRQVRQSKPGKVEQWEEQNTTGNDMERGRSGARKVGTGPGKKGVGW